MSIQTRCPSCDASYNLAESQRGKKVQCRKCSNIFVVGDESKKAPAAASAAKSGKIRKDALQTEPVSQSSLTPPPKAKAPAFRRDRDRDRDRDDEEEDDRRDRREPTKKKSGLSTPVILLISGGVLLVVLLGIGLTVGAVYWWTRQTVSNGLDNVTNAVQNGGAANGDPNNAGQPAVPDQPKDVSDAIIWIRTAQTTDLQNRAADWLAAATVTDDKQRAVVATALEDMATRGPTHDSAIKALAQWAGPENIPTLLRAADDDGYWRAGGPGNDAAAALIRLKADGAARIFVKRLPGFAHAAAKAKLADLCATGNAGIQAVQTAVLPYFDSPNNEARTDAQDLLRVSCGASSDVLFGQAVADLRSKDSGYARNAAEYVGKQPVDAARQDEVAKALVTALGDGNGETRTAAANALATWATKDSVPALIGALEHADVFGNGDFPAVLDALVRLKDEQGAEAIAKHLKSGFQREKTYNALRAMGKVAEKAVAAYVNDPDQAVADDANRLIKEYGTGGDVVFDATIKDLNAKDGKQRRAACDALAAHAVDPARQTEIARALEKLIDDPEPFNGIPEAAIKALVVWGDDKTGPVLVATMQKANGRLWQQSVDALVQRKDEVAVVPLLALVVPKKDFFHGDAAKKALNDMGGPVIESVMDKIIADPAEPMQLRIDCCALLLNPTVGTAKSVPVLTTASTDKNAQLKAKAAQVLAVIQKR